MLTTSRNPGVKTKMFARDLAKSLPGRNYLSRGKASLELLAAKARKQGKEVIVLAAEEKGLPCKLQGVKVSETGWQWLFEAKIKFLKPRKELGNSKQMVDALKLKLKSQPAKKLLAALNIASEKEAEFELRETKGMLSFFAGRQELGPRFKVEGFRLEA